MIWLLLWITYYADTGAVKNIEAMGFKNKAHCEIERKEKVKLTDSAWCFEVKVHE